MQQERLQSPFRYEANTHVPEELAIDIGHLASLETSAIPGYLERLSNRVQYPETYERYMGAIQDEALVFDALWTERNIDPMTELFNKSSWERQLETRIASAIEDENGPRRQGDLAVFVVDLDAFKKLNDTLGHATGDIAIERVGAYLRNNLRNSTANAHRDAAGHQPKAKSQPDQTGSHWGGDEFAVTAYFQPAKKDVYSKGRRKGQMKSAERAQIIAARLEAGITDVATQLRAELLLDPELADKVTEMDVLFGVTIGWAVRQRGGNGKQGQTSRELFKAADGDLERRKKEKRAALDESLDPELAAQIIEAEELLRRHGKIR